MKTLIYALVSVVMMTVSPAFAQSEESEVNWEVVQAALDNGDYEAGAKVFKRCKSCHMVGEGARNKTGPNLSTVFGSNVGTSEGFNYSKGMIALQEAGTVWTLENMDTFLTKPKEFVERTKMSFAGLSSAEDRANVFAYLAHEISETAEMEAAEHEGQDCDEEDEADPESSCEEHEDESTGPVQDD